MVKRSSIRLSLLLGAIAVMLVTASTTMSRGHGGGALVYALGGDPVVIDGPLVSDSNSIQVISQILEGLVGIKPGTTQVVPKLATSWKKSPSGLSWTFQLRRGVNFHDGTRFNAQGVCFNFNRQYNFKGSFQSLAASYYWQNVFGGFKRPEKGTPKTSIYKSCQAVAPYVVRINLSKPYPPLPQALTLAAFYIASPTALERYGADGGRFDASGVFQATGTYGTQHPTGTGPFKFNSWTVGDKLTLERNDNYWGKKAGLERLIFTPIADNSARFQALLNGEIDGYDPVAPENLASLRRNSGFRVLARPVFSVGYVGFQQNKAPLNNLAVRQAIAHGLDRKTVVKSFYGGLGTVADQFYPPSVAGYARGVKQYPYSPAKAKSILRKAGFKLPVKIDFYYPTGVSRHYMPDPIRNFQAFAASLGKSGFNVVPHSLPWRPDYLGNVVSGKTPVYIVGWVADFADPTNWVNVFFGQDTPEFAFKNVKLRSLLARAANENNPQKRIRLYQNANRMLMNFLPAVPYVWASSAAVVSTKVKGFVPNPGKFDQFSLVSLND